MKFLTQLHQGMLRPFKMSSKDTSPSQEHPNHHQLQPNIYKCHQSLRGFLMPSNSSDFSQILNIAPLGHMKTIHDVIKDTSPSQEHQYYHKLQQELQKCHRSLREFLIPSNLSDFNQILNIAPSGHMKTRGGTFQVSNLKKLKECCNFGILEGTYGMYFVLTVSGRNLQVGMFQN